MPTLFRNVRSEGQSGKHVLALSFSGFDPGCVKTRSRRECAELFSPFSSFDCDCQCCSFPIQRNQDKISTRKFDVGVFTQAGTADIVRLPSAQVFRHSQWTQRLGEGLRSQVFGRRENHLNREDGNESSALSSIRSVTPPSDQAARPDGPDRGQTKFRSTPQIHKPG